LRGKNEIYYLIKDLKNGLVWLLNDRRPINRRRKIMKSGNIKDIMNKCKN